MRFGVGCLGCGSEHVHVAAMPRRPSLIGRAVPCPLCGLGWRGFRPVVAAIGAVVGFPACRASRACTALLLCEDVV